MAKKCTLLAQTPSQARRYSDIDGLHHSPLVLKHGQVIELGYREQGTHLIKQTFSLSVPEPCGKAVEGLGSLPGAPVIVLLLWLIEAFLGTKSLLVVAVCMVVQTVSGVLVHDDTPLVFVVSPLIKCDSHAQSLRRCQ